MRTVTDEFGTLEGTSEAFLAASAARVAQMLYQHPEPGPTWQQSAQRAARLEPGRRQQQTRLLLRQSPVLYTRQLSLAILGKLTLEGLVLRLTT